jgi:ferredoxin
VALEVFAADDEGRWIVRCAQVPDRLRDSAELAREACPEFAVSFVDE